MLYRFLPRRTRYRDEVVSLRWGQLDLEQRVITVGRAKTGARRQIPINSELHTVLDMQASWYARKVAQNRPEHCVSPGRLGRPESGTKRPLDRSVQ